MDYFKDVLATFLGIAVMQGQKALGFRQKYLNFYVPKINEVVWNDMSVSN